MVTSAQLPSLQPKIPPPFCSATVTLPSLPTQEIVKLALVLAQPITPPYDLPVMEQVASRITFLTTTPPVTVPKRPTPCCSGRLTVRLLMRWNCPSKEPVNLLSGVPIGSNSMPAMSISAVRTASALFPIATYLLSQLSCLPFPICSTPSICGTKFISTLPQTVQKPSSY